MLRSFGARIGSTGLRGRIVAVIGRAGRNISVADALQHVVGYSIFNDASIRDYQFKSPQWTIGKNFDDTGPFGPYLVTADELPAGGKDLRLQTRSTAKSSRRHRRMTWCLTSPR